MSVIKIEEIQSMMPHRYPFLLIDRVHSVDLDAENGAVIHAYKNVTINEDFFNGHFPGHPIMPGVLTLEAMAQAAGILAVNMSKERADGSIIFYFAGINNARFKRPVTPGDRLDLEARFIACKRGIWKFECRAMVDGELACSAEIISAERNLEEE